MAIVRIAIVGTGEVREFTFKDQDNANQAYNHACNRLIQDWRQDRDEKSEPNDMLSDGT